MRIRRNIFLVTIFIILSCCPLLAEDYYSWMPSGGCQLLFETYKRCKNCDSLQELVKLNYTQDEWKAYFQGKQGALSGISDKQLRTLVSYLTLYFPVQNEKVKQNPDKIDCSILPSDGKILSLEACTLCHPIGPVLSQKKDISGWIGLYGRPPHDEVELSEKDIKALTNYLSINTPMALDEIPAEHKAELPGF